MKEQVVSPRSLKELFTDVFEIEKPLSYTDEEMVNLLNVEFRRLYRQLDIARAGLRIKSKECLSLAEKVNRLW